MQSGIRSIGRRNLYCSPLLCALMCGVILLASAGQRVGGSKEKIIPVDFFEQLDLPISINAATVERCEDHMCIKARIANRADEQVSGASFQLIVLNESGKTIDRQTWVEKIDLDPGELKPASLRVPKSRELSSRNRKIFLAVDEVFGSNSIWVAFKVPETLEKYGAGDQYVLPAVKRVTNTVDSPP